MSTRFILLGLSLCRPGLTLVSKDRITGRLPAMGWNSWNEYRCDINETVFLTVGGLLVSTGLKDLGYQYVNIDDCWSDKVAKRDNSTGKILPDFQKFPGGIKRTADEIHKLGLKLGIYSDAGSLTCGGYAGSLGHEEVDAKTWAEWGIDCSCTHSIPELLLMRFRPQIR
jgi:alpha-galactosidase